MNRHGMTCFTILAAALSLHAGGALAQTSSEPAQSAPATPPAATPGRTPDLTARPSAAAADAHAGASRNYRLQFDTGARFSPDESGDLEKFEEYGDVDDGFFLDRLEFSSQRPETAHHVEIGIENAIQDDESYRIEVGTRGRYRFGFTYDETPHTFTSGRFLWSGRGTGRLMIADVAQDRLQFFEQTSTERGPGSTDPNTDTTGEDASQQGIVRGLYSAADGIRFGLVRRQIGTSLEFELTRSATAWARVLNENRTGTRVVGTGSYERWAVGSALTHAQDRFIVLGAELAEPIDYRTFGVAAGAGVHGESWLANVEYTLTQFRNFEDTLLWDNPFRITDAATTGAPAANAFDRSRFVVGQLVLPPNSLAHDVTATGGMDLPMHGRLAASVSVGLITQDEAFQPWTQNTAVIATDNAGVAVGAAPTAALPAADLDGEVRTLAGTLQATVRPADPIHVAAKYRVYRYDNESEEIEWPGYAGFGESVWRRQRIDVPAVGGVGLVLGRFTNDVFDYWRHEADLDVDYRVSRMLSVAVMGGWEAWRFSHLRLDKLDEFSVGAGFTVKPVRNASLKVTYRYADREADGYNRGNSIWNQEARGLMNFNWSDRERHAVDARLRYSPTRLVSLGVLGSFVDEEYGGNTDGGTMIDEFRFGRTDVRRWLGSADVTVTPADRLSVNVSYTFEQREEGMANAAKDDPGKASDDFVDAGAAPLGDNFAPENYWSSDITELVNTVAVSGSFQLIPGKVSLDAGYNLSFSDIEVDTFNPSPGNFTSGNADFMLLNAVAQHWPTIKSRQHEIFVDLGYHLTQHVRAGARYLYAAYDLDDFAWDVMRPYMAGISAENSTRMVFTDATYNEYQVHVGSVYLSGRY